MVRKLVAKGGGAYVERLSETTPRIMIEERTTSECGVNEVRGRDGGNVLHGLLGLEERVKRSLEAEQRRKGDVHHQRQVSGRLGLGEESSAEGRSGQKGRGSDTKSRPGMSYIPMNLIHSGARTTRRGRHGEQGLDKGSNPCQRLQ